MKYMKLQDGDFIYICFFGENGLFWILPNPHDLPPHSWSVITSLRSAKICSSQKQLNCSKTQVQAATARKLPQICKCWSNSVLSARNNQMSPLYQILRPFGRTFSWQNSTIYIHISFFWWRHPFRVFFHDITWREFSSNLFTTNSIAATRMKAKNLSKSDTQTLENHLT